MDPKEYEQWVREEIALRYPEASITWNAKVTGRLSGVERQVDVLVEADVCDAQIRVVIDAKRHSAPVDLKDVESFLSMMDDLGAHRGMMIASSGYTAGALRRAHADPADLELDVLSLADLQALQGEEAIPFAGGGGVIMRAPFGWVVDATLRPGRVATLYQRGRDLSEAGAALEWAYVNFWSKALDGKSLEQLRADQDAVLRAADPATVITSLPGPRRRDARTAVRLAKVPSYPALEFTGFVEFQDFIFFIVLYTPELLAERNLRKLRELLRSVVPLKVTGNTSG